MIESSHSALSLRPLLLVSCFEVPPLTHQQYNLGGDDSYTRVGKEREPVVENGFVRGVAWDDGLARFCQLSGTTPQRSDESPFCQFLDVMGSLERQLAAAGFTFRDVVRTWFYVGGILNVYGDFNRARRSFFESRGLLGGRLPASTAVGIDADGPAVIASALAVRPHDDRMRIDAARSPMQQEASEYGSLFSRGMCLRGPLGMRLIVSGTASIDEQGRTLFVGDTEAQIERSLDVVEAMFAAEGLVWNDATCGIAYFRRHQDVSLVEQVRRRGMLAPLVAMRADICRDDLLFEIEIDAGKRIP